MSNGQPGPVDQEEQDLQLLSETGSERAGNAGFTDEEVERSQQGTALFPETEEPGGWLQERIFDPAIEWMGGLFGEQIKMGALSSEHPVSHITAPAQPGSPISAPAQPGINSITAPAQPIINSNESLKQKLEATASFQDELLEKADTDADRDAIREDQAITNQAIERLSVVAGQDKWDPVYDHRRQPLQPSEEPTTPSTVYTDVTGRVGGEPEHEKGSPAWEAVMADRRLWDPDISLDPNVPQTFVGINWPPTYRTAGQAGAVVNQVVQTIRKANPGGMFGGGFDQMVDADDDGISEYREHVESDWIAATSSSPGRWGPPTGPLSPMHGFRGLAENQSGHLHRTGARTLIRGGTEYEVTGGIKTAADLIRTHAPEWKWVEQGNGTWKKVKENDTEAYIAAYKATAKALGVYADGLLTDEADQWLVLAIVISSKEAGFAVPFSETDMFEGIGTAKRSGTRPRSRIGRFNEEWAQDAPNRWTFHRNQRTGHVRVERIDEEGNRHSAVINASGAPADVTIPTTTNHPADAPGFGDAINNADYETRTKIKTRSLDPRKFAQIDEDDGVA